jgi:phosphopantothenoylcysteine synthetase/decarboxylase
MKILVTAGNTQTPIDQVRCITNIFTGRTGAKVALEAHRRGHQVCLLTSHPEAVADLAGDRPPRGENWSLRSYRTFDHLHSEMAQLIPQGPFDAVIHSAAVSDYRVEGIYVPDQGTRFDVARRCWSSAEGVPELVETSAGKIKSSHEEMWFRLVRTPKLVDFIRSPWGFQGVLVKFKLEVGVSDKVLLEIAERSRLQSRADLMAANTLEGKDDWVCLGPIGGQYLRLARPELAARLLSAVEELQRTRNGG